MTIEQLLGVVQTAGAGTTVIFAIMWWLERQERLRLQRVLEGFLPTIRNVLRSVNRAVSTEGDEDA